jgi:hypothetical protein
MLMAAPEAVHAMRGSIMWRFVLCGFVSWLILSAGTSVRADDAEDKAVAFVEKLGGKIKRDDKVAGKPVVEVNLFRTKVTDADLKELAALKSLTSLNLHDTKVTDAGLKELVPLKNLSFLSLGRTEVTDAGLKELEVPNGWWTAGKWCTL